MEPTLATDRLLEATLGSLDVGVVVEDAAGRVLASNPAAERILGSGATAMHEDGWPLADDARPSAVALRTGRPCAGVTIGFKRPGGDVTWVVANARPLTEVDRERPWAVVTSYADVTGARRERDEERRGAERFRSLIEYSSDAISIIDEQGRQTYESPAIERVLGYAPGDFDGVSRLSQVHPEDSSAVVSAISSVVSRPGASTAVEYRIQAADGSWRIVESIATNRMHDPAVLGIVVNTRDMTERRREQAVLRATTSRLTNLVQNLKFGVLVEDEDRHIALVNEDFCSIFSVDAPPSALVGADCTATAERAAGRVEDPDGFARRVEELVAARKPVTREEVAFADGRTFERDYIPIAVEGADRGHLWLYRDISDRKAAERDAAAARDEAIRASRLKSDFLATMSHEIRTPMNGVIGTIELLLDTTLSPDQRDLAGVVRDSARGLLSLIDDALDLSKIEAEKLEPKEVEFELAAVVEDVADVLLPGARRKGLWMTSFADPRASARMRGDAQWLRQVLLNLLGNAVKFTEAGEVHARAELRARGSASATVRFAVSDAGPGIPDAERSRLFEPFAQLGSATEPRRPGTGLGLAICQRLVGLMGGEIDVASTVGEGSTFSFTLTFPLAAPGRPADVPPRRELRVLLVEACDAASRVVGEYMDAWGMAGERAATAEHALELMRSATERGQPFDVAVLGTTLPEPAVALAESLLSVAAGPGPAFVLLKDVANDAARDGATPAPFATELNKPVKQARLFDALVGAVDPESRPRRAPAEQRRPPFRPPPGTRVLVAEDDEMSRELIVRQLAALGVHADAVGTGTAAVEALGRHPYDVVLMDCQMPELDGRGAAGEIRAHEPEDRRTTIVAVTASADPDEVDTCLAAGMDACLTKPFSTVELSGALGRVLQPDPAHEEGPLDHSALDRLQADLGDQAVVARIAGLFVDALREARERLAAAVAARDHDELRRVAHRLRSSSATFGAERLAHLCDELESLADIEDEVRPAALAGEIANESWRVSDALAAQLAQPPSSSR
jgi:two-component system sensor histidine kinase/response regulator